MNMLIIATVASLAWWAQARHDAANTGRIYGRANIQGFQVSVTTIDLGLPIESRYGATVGDVDGDGQNEILVVAGAYSGSNLLAMLRYAGPGSLMVEKTHNFTGNPIAVDCAPALCDVGRWSQPGMLDNFPDVIWTLGSAGLVQAVDFGPIFPGLIWQASDSWVDPSSPTIADFNDDGIGDVVIGFQNPQKVYLINGADGTVMNSKTTEGKIYCKPAAGDIDNDGEPEIVVVDAGGDVYYWDNVAAGDIFTKILDYTGAGRAGWASPVLCNLDSDPGLEIVVYLTKSPNEAEVIALDGPSGGILWNTTVPSNIGIHYYTAGSPAVCDLNGDGTVDVVVTTTFNSVGRVYALDGKTGIPLPGFPVLGLEAIHTAPAIADLVDADGSMSTYDPEIVAVGIDGQLYLISSSGVILTSLNLDDFPSDTILAAPTIADCDDDGDLEIVVCRGKGGNLGRVYVIDGPKLPEPIWSEVPITAYNPPPQPSWNARFLDASVMPPAKAVDHNYGVDPNLTSKRVAVVGMSNEPFMNTGIRYIAYYSDDGGSTWNGSTITRNWPISSLPNLRASRYILAGVHLMPQIAFEPPILNGVAVGYAYVSHAGIDKWYGCILVTTDGGVSWEDWTGDLLGVLDPQFLPSAPLTDVTIVTNGGDHKTWIVGFQGYQGNVITGKLIPGGLDFGISPPCCGQIPWIDLYGVHAYYPYPGITQQVVWVTGRWGRGSMGGGYIDWGYQAVPNNPNSIHWGTSPLCSEDVAEFHDAIYDLWAQGAQMPSLPGHSNFFGDIDEAGISDSVFAVGKKKGGAGGAPWAIIFGTVDKLKSYEIQPYRQNRAFYDISTFEYPALRRYVFGEGPIRYWDVNFTNEDNFLPDETGGITIKNDIEAGPVPPGRILYGSADNAGIAVGRMSTSGLPTIWKKGSFDYATSGDLTPVPFGPPEIFWCKSQNNGQVAWVVWNHNTEPTVRDYRIRAYPMGQGSEDWSSLLTFNVETFVNTPSDSGHWDAIGVKAVDYWGNESQASDDLGDTSLFYHPGPGAVSDTLALFPSSSENLVMDNDGVAHLVYASRSLEDGEYHIYYIYRPFGGSWSEPHDLGRGYAPTIAFWNDTSDFAGATLLLAYTVHQGKTSKLMMRKKSPGGSWSPARMLAVFNPSSPYLGMGAPDILDVFRGGQTPVFMGAGDPPRAYVALKAPLRDGRKDRVKGYRLLLWSVDPVSLNAVGPEIVDSLSVVPFDVPEREAFLAGVGGVSITGIKVFNQYHQHIAWDCDGDSLSVLWRRNPGYPWSRMDLSGCFYGYANEAKEPYVMAVGGASAPPDTYSVIYITFCGRNNNAQPYSVYLSTLFTHQPAGFPWRVSDGKSDTKNPILSGWNWWSQNVGGDWEVFKGNPWGYRVLISKTPWARSIYPQYTWGTNPYYEVALYLEEDPKDGECGLIRRGYEPSPITSQMWSFGDPFPTPATLERGGFIVYDTVAPALTADTASSRLSYILPDWNLRDGEEYALVLVFYHQEPDTQALRAVICSDTYTVYVPPNEEYFWQTNVMAHSPISLSVEKLDGARAFLSGAYLVPTGEGKGGPQSQGLGGLSFSLSACPTVSKGIFSIQLSLPLRQEIDLSLYDVTGRMALSVAKGVYAPGTYTFTVNPRQLSSGIYYLRLVSPQYRETKKLILTK